MDPPSFGALPVGSHPSHCSAGRSTPAGFSITPNNAKSGTPAERVLRLFDPRASLRVGNRRRPAGRATFDIVRRRRPSSDLPRGRRTMSRVAIHGKRVQRGWAVRVSRRTWRDLLPQPSDRLFDLSRFRESPGLELREHNGAVHLDVVDPAAPFDEARLVAELTLQIGRQTGGPWSVVSLTAVFDGDLHARLQSRAAIVS